MSKKKVGAATLKVAVPNEFYTFKEFSKKLRISPVTLRRRMVDGKCKGLVTMDPFGLGRPLITKESADNFLLIRLKETVKAASPAPQSHG